MGQRRGKTRARGGGRTRVAEDAPVCHKRVAPAERAYSPDGHGDRTGLCWGASRLRSARCRAAAELAGATTHPHSPFHPRDIFGAFRSVRLYFLSGVGFSQRHRRSTGCQSRGILTAGVRGPEPSLLTYHLPTARCEQGMHFPMMKSLFLML